MSTANSNEAKERQWFALGWDGNVYALGDCGDYEAADEVAKDTGIDAVWLACYETATQWRDAIAKQLGRFE
jgi:hypothetical protein